MKRFQNEFDVVLVGVDTVEAELARDVLAKAGIPSLVHGPDFDIAEFGAAAYGQLRRGNLLVPRGARAAARAALVEAWGEDAVVRREEPGPTADGSARAGA
ncbi:MAG: hypothetical protein JNK02_02435 [Planctomycetes bacterium]|nr:hypothetical protein [Planctomycetota bacterium]